MPKYFEFEVSLAEVEPKIWRRFLIRPAATFLDLHYAIQDACGWEHAHLFEFFKQRPYRDGIAGIDLEDPESGEPIPDAGELRLDSYFGHGAGKKRKCIYVYDFGDDWVHDVRLLRTVTLDEEFHRRLLGGERAFPPEDCGGIWGYYNCIEVLEEDSDSERREWLGDWSPDDFDAAQLQNAFDA